MASNWQEMRDINDQVFHRKLRIDNGIVDVRLNKAGTAWVGTFISTDNKTRFTVDKYKNQMPFPNTPYGLFDCKIRTAQRYSWLYTAHKMLGPNKNPLYTSENPIKPRTSSYVSKNKPKTPKSPKSNKTMYKPSPKLRKKKMTLSEEAIEYGKTGPLIVANG
ncbi:MAG: hypothetical protein K0U41_06470 [Gammaproteobacteria bacterium]|nr:hypothetical protein [Gammaproteobacteria bacterium]